MLRHHLILDSPALSALELDLHFETPLAGSIDTAIPNSKLLVWRVYEIIPTYLHAENTKRLPTDHLQLSGQHRGPMTQHGLPALPRQDQEQWVWKEHLSIPRLPSPTLPCTVFLTLSRCKVEYYFLYVSLKYTWDTVPAFFPSTFRNKPQPVLKTDEQKPHTT